MERERDKQSKEAGESNEKGKERDDSPTGNKHKAKTAGDRQHHSQREPPAVGIDEGRAKDIKSSTKGGDKADERRGNDDGKRHNGRAKSGDDLRTDRTKVVGSERGAKGGTDDRLYERPKLNGGAEDGKAERSREIIKEKPRYTAKSWKEKDKDKEREKDKEIYNNGSTSARAVPTRNGDLISATLSGSVPTSATSKSPKYDPSKRRSMIADSPSSAKRDLTSVGKTETALDRIVKDINAQKQTSQSLVGKRPGSTHYVSISGSNDTNDLRLREVTGSDDLDDEENNRRLVWRKNHPGAAPLAGGAPATESSKRSGGSLIVRPSEPASKEPYAKEWRKSREVVKESTGRDTASRESRESAASSTTTTREPPVPGAGGPAMPSSSKPSSVPAKYDLLAPMRESLAQRAKADSDQKLYAEVKELRSKVRQLEKTLKQERDDARRYKAQLDMLRSDMEDVLIRAATRAREETSTASDRDKVLKQKVLADSVEKKPIVEDEPKGHSREHLPSPVAPVAPSAPTTISAPTPAVSLVSAAAPVSSSSSSLASVSASAHHAPVDKAPVAHSEKETSSAAPRAHADKATTSGTSPAQAEQPAAAVSDASTVESSPVVAPSRPAAPFGNTAATKDLSCFAAKRYWPKEKEKESLVVVIHVNGIRVVKPFTEEVVYELKWDEVLRWSANHEEHTFRFFVESRSTSTLINHTYEAEDIKEISLLVAKFTYEEEEKKEEESGKKPNDGVAAGTGATTPSTSSSSSSSSKDSRPASGSDIERPLHSESNGSARPRSAKSRLLKKFSSFQRKKKSVAMN